jgi:raffinose/stachyose/melibiose transport system permease protein
MNRLLQDRKAIAFFVLPAFLIYLFAVLVPIACSISYSFFEGVPGIKFTFVGIANYLKMWSDRYFLGSLAMNLKYVAVVTTGQVGFGLLLSLMFMFGIKRFKTLVRTLVFFPVVLPVMAVGQLFSKMFEITPQNGLVNSLLDIAGLDRLIQPWLGQTGTALGVLCTQDIWTAMGFYAVIYYAALMNIPTELIEASTIDGANGLRMTRSIILPLLRPITVTCLVFSFTGTLKVFESPLALTRGGPGTATQSLSMYMYDASFLFSQYGYGSAIAVFILLECLVVSGALNVLFSRDPY